MATALKFMEDEIFYEKLDINRYLWYFGKWFDEKIEFPISENDLNMWHKWLKRYFSKKPDIQSMTEFGLFMNIWIDDINSILDNYIIIREDKTALQYIDSLYNNFDLIITSGI